MQTASFTRSVLALSVLLGSAPIGAALAAEATLAQPAIARLARLPAISYRHCSVLQRVDGYDYSCNPT